MTPHWPRQQANANMLGLPIADYLALPRRERKRRVQRVRQAQRANVRWFCCYCAVGEGVVHRDYCHRSGVMQREEMRDA